MCVCERVCVSMCVCLCVRVCVSMCERVCVYVCERQPKNGCFGHCHETEAADR